jgi:hypothetical protein
MCVKHVGNVKKNSVEMHTENVQYASMTQDIRPDAAKRLEQARIARGFRFAKDACTYFGWNYNSYAQHESGQRGLGRAAGKYAKAYRVGEGWLLTGEGKGPSDSEAATDPLTQEFHELFSKASEEDQQAILRLMRSLVAAQKG